MALTARMVTIDCADSARLVKFWTEALGYQIEADYGGEYVILRPGTDDGLRLALQRVPEPRTGKNRVHVDFEAEDRRAEVQRLTALGATVVAEHVEQNFAWTVLTDPEGNEFCVAGRE